MELFDWLNTLTVVVQVEAKETEVVRDQLQREGIELISGTARFLPGSEGEPHRVMVLRTSEKTEAKTRSAWRGWLALQSMEFLSILSASFGTNECGGY